MGKPTFVALAAALVVYPAIRATEPDFFLVGGPQDWWRFWGVAALGHWLVFGLVVWALRREGSGWESIGLDGSWFVRRRNWMIVIAVFLLAGVFGVSAVSSSEPRVSLFPLQATTWPNGWS